MMSILDASAEICSEFARYGYCQEGNACPKRHLFHCTQFEKTGTCQDPKCRLIHRKPEPSKKVEEDVYLPMFEEIESGNVFMTNEFEKDLSMDESSVEITDEDDEGVLRIYLDDGKETNDFI